MAYDLYFLLNMLITDLNLYFLESFKALKEKIKTNVSIWYKVTIYHVWINTVFQQLNCILILDIKPATAKLLSSEYILFRKLLKKIKNKTSCVQF